MKSGNSSGQMWQDYSDKLKTFIASRIKDADNCQDILQDVFLKITEKEERLKWIEQPASYVIKMAQNAIIDHYRSKKNTTQPLPAGDFTFEEKQQEIKLADCCLLSFIKALPPLYSEAMILSDLEGMSQKQLSQHLGISYTGAKSRVQRARKMLKEAILACCPYQFDKYGNIIGCCK